MDELYKQLADRNGWTYNNIEGRPYFMKDGSYAIPDDNTSEEDKLMLAEIISEGSIEMEKLILNCWDNGIIISGPCSGIKEYHDSSCNLHFSFIGNKELLYSLSRALKPIFPKFDHICREKNDITRYDINYYLDLGITREESNSIFRIINDQFLLELEKNKSKKNNI